MSISRAPSPTERRISSRRVSSGTRPAGKPVETAATGIFGGAAPFMLFLEATKRIPTTTTAQVGTLVPVIALIGGVLFLGDQPSGFQLLGTAIVVVALSALARYTRAH